MLLAITIASGRLSQSNPFGILSIQIRLVIDRGGTSTVPVKVPQYRRLGVSQGLAPPHCRPPPSRAKSAEIFVLRKVGAWVAREGANRPGWTWRETPALATQAPAFPREGGGEQTGMDLARDTPEGRDRRPKTEG